ncbi:hypothetical protein TIFTF001_029660 [Ficus carica]|uniref:Uncharacterized protein n=1 Tax=Ficus carica TaxID=3494 RepID=A0AA88J342_FICCA|nr:hypothetical protein TIFTF001_029660 [Ficus carica]
MRAERRRPPASVSNLLGEGVGDGRVLHPYSLARPMGWPYGQRNIEHYHSAWACGLASGLGSRHEAAGLGLVEGNGLGTWTGSGDTNTGPGLRTYVQETRVGPQGPHGPLMAALVWAVGLDTWQAMVQVGPKICGYFGCKEDENALKRTNRAKWLTRERCSASCIRGECCGASCACGQPSDP